MQSKVLSFVTRKRSQKNTFMLSFECAQDFRLMRDLQKRKHIVFQRGCLIKIQIGKQPKTSLHA